MGWRGERMALANIRASRSRRSTLRILRLRATRLIGAPYATKRLEGEPWVKGWPRSSSPLLFVLPSWRYKGPAAGFDEPGLGGADCWLSQEDEHSIPSDETRTQECGLRCTDARDQCARRKVAQRPNTHNEKRVQAHHAPSHLLGHPSLQQRDRRRSSQDLTDAERHKSCHGDPQPMTEGEHRESANPNHDAAEVKIPLAGTVAQRSQHQRPED